MPTVPNRLALLAGAAIVLGACSAPAAVPTAPPAPTPQVIVKTVDVPGPTVTLTPKVCLDALRGLDAALGAENDLLGAYLQDQVPTDAQIAAFLDLDADGIYADVDACLATDAGS